MYCRNESIVTILYSTMSSFAHAYSFTHYCTNLVRFLYYLYILYSVLYTCTLYSVQYMIVQEESLNNMQWNAVNCLHFGSEVLKVYHHQRCQDKPICKVNLEKLLRPNPPPNLGRCHLWLRSSPVIIKRYWTSSKL